MTRDYAEKLFEIRRADSFMTCPDEQTLVVPTGIVGKDGREVAMALTWHGVLRAFSEVMRQRAEGEPGT